jgi:hypothetical protein
MIYLISFKLLLTDIPTPLLVFSPGLIIQIFDGLSFRFLSLTCLGIECMALLVTPRIYWVFISFGRGSNEADLLTSCEDFLDS